MPGACRLLCPLWCRPVTGCAPNSPLCSPRRERVGSVLGLVFRPTYRADRRALSPHVPRAPQTRASGESDRLPRSQACPRGGRNRQPSGRRLADPARSSARPGSAARPLLRSPSDPFSARETKAIVLERRLDPRRINLPRLRSPLWPGPCPAAAPRPPRPAFCPPDHRRAELLPSPPRATFPLVCRTPRPSFPRPPSWGSAGEPQVPASPSPQVWCGHVLAKPWLSLFSAHGPQAPVQTAGP